MSVLKSEIKLQVLGDIGNRMDDRLEAALVDVNASKGAAVASAKIRDDIQGLLAHVDKDVDEGVYDLEMAKVVKRYIVRSAQIAENQREQQGIFGNMAKGKVDAMKEAVELVKSMFTAERSMRDEQMKVLVAAQAAGIDPDDVRRPKSIKEQRMSEDEAESTEPPADTEPTESAPRKRRARASNT